MSGENSGATSHTVETSLVEQLQVRNQTLFITMPNHDGQDRGDRFEQIALAVRNRDAGRCQRCEQPEGDERLSVHHLVPDTKVPEGLDAHLPVNLVTLCRSCHAEMEAKTIEGQLRKLQIETQADLLLTEQERERLNERLDDIGPEILNTKTVSAHESREFLDHDFDLGGAQVDLTEFQ